VHYDPLVAKVIADGPTRETARRRAIEALRNFPILGIRTNIAFLINVLEHARFAAGDIDTRFLDVEGEGLRKPAPVPAEAIELAVDLSRRSAVGEGDRANADPWDSLKGFRG